jgi:hypothetical protein
VNNRWVTLVVAMVVVVVVVERVVVEVTASFVKYAVALFC